MLRNVKDDKTFLSAKFQFSVIQFIKVFSNKPFFLVKALNPGLKLLENSIDISFHAFTKLKLSSYSKEQQVFNIYAFYLTVTKAGIFPSKTDWDPLLLKNVP